MYFNKGKGIMSSYNSYKGVPLLNVANKMSQCGICEAIFNISTTSMKQYQQLCLCFVDLGKAFDIQLRGHLAILENLAAQVERLQSLKLPD